MGVKLKDIVEPEKINFNDLEGSQITPDLLGSIDAMDETPLPLLYQTGYLTIEGYDKEFNEYSLNFPNKEVKSGFVNFLARFYRQKGAGSE